jgi:hypothetical protein
LGGAAAEALRNPAKVSDAESAGSHQSVFVFAVLEHSSSISGSYPGAFFPAKIFICCFFFTTPS